MKKVSLVCLLVAACGGGGSTADVSVTVASNATGKALQPIVEAVPENTSFSSDEPSQTFTIDGAELQTLWPLLALVQAAPDTFADALTVTVTTEKSGAEAVLSSSASATDGCAFAFDPLPVKPDASCGKDLVKGLKLLPAPSKLELLATVSKFENVAFGAAVEFGASVVSPGGVPRTLVWGSQGTIAKVVPPAKTTIASIAGTVVSGTINVATPPNSGSDLTASVFLIVDFNADGVVSADEVTTGTVTLGEDVELSTIVTVAAADKIITAAQAADLKYALVAAVRSKAGNINGTAARNGIDVTATLSFKTTATTKAAN